MKHFFNFINPFHKPPAKQLMEETLAEYQRQLIVAESAAAYNKKLSEFYRESVVRLQSQLVSY